MFNQFLADASSTSKGARPKTAIHRPVVRQTIEPLIINNRVKSARPTKNGDRLPKVTNSLVDTKRSTVQTHKHTVLPVLVSNTNQKKRKECKSKDWIFDCVRKLGRSNLIQHNEAVHTSYKPIIVDCFRTKAVVAKKVNWYLDPSERIGCHYTYLSYCIRIAARFPNGRKNYSVLPSLSKRHPKEKLRSKTHCRILLAKKVLSKRHPLWPSLSKIYKQNRLKKRKEKESRKQEKSSTGQASKLSKESLKVIKEMHLEDVIRRREEREKMELRKELKAKPKKKIKVAPVKKVKYIEAPYPLTPEEQLATYQKKRERKQAPTENDFQTFGLMMTHNFEEHQLTQPDEKLIKISPKDLKQELMRNIRFRIIVTQLTMELKQCYLHGIKRSILLYALRCPDERKRLKITVSPYFFEPFQLRAPVLWHQNVTTSRNYCYHNLFILNKILRRIDQLWEDQAVGFSLKSSTEDLHKTAKKERYAKHRFVNLEDLVNAIDITESCESVLTPFELEEKVNSSCKNMRKMLLDKWLPKIKIILREELNSWKSLVPTDPSESTRQIKRFFDTVRSRMSLQLRQMVLRTVKEFLKVLYKHQTSNAYIGEYDESKFVVQPIFKIALKVINGNLDFSPTLEESRQCLLNCLSYVIQANEKFPQIEQLLGNDKQSKALFLHSVQMEQETMQSALRSVNEIFDQNLEGPRQYLEKYSKFQTLMNGDLEAEVSDFIANAGDLRVFLESGGRRRLDATRAAIVEAGYKKLNRLIGLKEELLWMSNDAVLGLPMVSCLELNSTLLLQCQGLCDRIVDYFASHNKKHNKEICRIFDDISTRLSEVTDVTAEIVELSNFLHECSSQTLPQLLNEIQNTTDRVYFLIQFGKLPDDHVPLLGRMYAWPAKIQEDFRLAEIRLSHKRDQKEAALKERVRVFDETLTGYARELEDLKSRDNFSMKEIRVETMKRNVELLDKLTVHLQSAKTELQAINEEQSLLSWEITKFPTLHQILAQKEPYDKLWHTTYDFNQEHELWYNGPFKGLDAESISEQVENMWKIMYRLTKTFVDQIGSRRVAEYVKNKIEIFRQHVPILQCICNPGLRQRHWDQLGEELGSPLELTDTTSLADMIELGLPSIQRKLEEISHAASKEFSLERSLEKMKSEWVDVLFEFRSWRDTGVSILSAVDDIQVLLDEHTQKVQTMRGSPYIKPFEDEIRSWENKLLSMQDILDAWVKCQVTWLYLEPIFSSDDIMKQMPVEGRKFTRVDTTWREIMTAAVQDPRALIATDQPNMFERLEENNSLLEDIQKGLNDYLERKRLFFPRFFFLSNDELLEILSETKDPQRVQPHLRKCFQGIDSLSFSSAQEIEGMISAEGEVVQFSNRVIPAKARGLVEKWLLEVENMMVQSLQDVMVRAVENYPQVNHQKWILKWPSQVVLTVSQMLWTTEVSELIEKGDLKSLVPVMNTRIEEVVSLVRGELEPAIRITLGSLIVTYVHGRDCTRDLIEKGVTSLDDFSWVSQLRYLWINELVQVHMVMTCLNYGYEYLGNTSRLVMTPLTDRCFRTLMGALKFHLGGAPEGPAGTGKTETCKDLAKSVAKQCIIFNCSESLDCKSMAKFFKGLAQSGSWACFDEFNRMELEVLSVVAQQVQTLQSAVSRGVRRLNFDGSDLLLNPSCSIFITMNPGYAGRQALPDNLKVLFRTVAMMVPDYVMISKISLFSMGFVEADSLARKIIDTYRLCSEQLSSQHHYDYGMRAVKAVLIAAGSLKLDFPDLPESKLIVKAIRDVNLPKFLSQDVSLFEGIIKDLFPAQDEFDSRLASLADAIKETLETKNLQNVDWLRQKILQLYNMIRVRHGVMIVGESLSGKTTSYQTLSAALDLIKSSKSLQGEAGVNYKVINPKSLTLGQLYGAYDPFSHEWSDGVLAKTFREMSTSSSEERRWVVFDGPVDSLWVENLNTALDDNKKLCLMSGEIIQLHEKMNIMFETSDLEQASPATVSRCGMVYMESKQLGWRPLKTSYLAELSSILKEQMLDTIDTLLEWLVPPLLLFIRKKCKPVVHTTDIYLFKSLTRLYDSMLDEVKDAEKPLGPKITEEKLFAMIQSLLVFVIPWSIGSTLSDVHRKSFDQFLRHLLIGRNEQHPIPSTIKITKGLLYPEGGLVYDYFYEASTNRWLQWHETIDPERSTIPIGANLSQLIIPTAETARQEFFLKTCLEHNVPLLMIGPTGTGKSAITNSYLMGLPNEKYIVNIVNFSARTTAGQTQEVIMSKVDRRRKGVFGPAMGKKYVVFIDDVNMPQKEEYGAQPPLEFLRQWLDHRHFYDRKDTTRVELVDSILLAATGLPGGGRNSVCGRFMRHMNIFTIDAFNDTALEKIYGTITGWHLAAHNDTAMQRLSRPLMDATREVYRKTLTSFLPTPVKSHYLFNLRDFARVVAGILLVPVDFLASVDKLFRLWIHEVYRVFHDRLSDDSDRKTFYSIVRAAGERSFRLNIETVLSSLVPKGDLEPQHLNNLIFGDFLLAEEEAKTYDEISDLDHLKKVIENYLHEYNMVNKNPMPLVVFPYMLHHISRVSRVLKQPNGHLLLIGYGGSGRQSVTKLAAFMANYDLFQIEVTKSYGQSEWREDVKKVLLRAGGDGKPSVFLLVDNQLRHESFVEDINLLLNMADLPNLYSNEEKTEIMEKMQSAAKEESKKLDASPLAYYNYYVERVRANLHLVIVMSPIGDEYRQRLRTFPSLVNCCTIDWYTKWPNDSLEQLAYTHLRETSLDESLLSRCVESCKEFHHSAQELSENFMEEAGRKVYITPTTYLDLILTAKKLLIMKRSEISTLRQRYLTGLQKLAESEQLITDLQEELKNLQPRLVQTSANTEALMVKIEQDTIQVEKKKELVAADEAVANKKFADAQAIKDDCEKELAKAVPALSAATEALNTLRQDDVRVVKAMKNPPIGVKMVMEAVCVMLDVKPERRPDPNGSGRMIEDFWGPSQRLLGDLRLLPNLLLYDKDNIPPRIINIVRDKYYSHPDFEPKKIRNTSTACEGLCRWVRAMVVYDQVIKIVAPKKQDLERANEELALQNEKLEMKRKELREVTDKLQALNDEFTKKQKEKKDLEDSIVKCKQKRDRSERLIGGLGGEKGRWSEVAQSLSEKLEHVVGDVMLSAALIAYLGPFTVEYREKCIIQLRKICDKLSISCSSEYSLAATLAEPVEIRMWHAASLPVDSFSIDNALIMKHSRQWPLMIDPQGQANRWIHNMEAPNGLLVTKPSDPQLQSILEKSLQNGLPLLIENVGEEIDPLFDPVLFGQTFKQQGVEHIRLGDTITEYNPKFKLYFTSRFRNPHYLPQITAKVSLINFLITKLGLENQLLGLVVAHERPELEEKKNNLLTESAHNRQSLQETQQKILEVLSTESQNLLEDEKAIEIMSSSRALSEDITAKEEIVQDTEKQIDRARNAYKPVSFHASILFFCVAELGALEHVYQYSLTWFIGLYLQSIESSSYHEEVDFRIAQIKKHLTKTVFEAVSRSLFEEHKILFSFMLSVRLSQAKGLFSDDVWQFLLVGGKYLQENSQTNPHPDWLSKRSWNQICMASKCKSLSGFAEGVSRNPEQWKKILHSDEPQKEVFPEPYATVEGLERIAVLKCIRPDKVVSSVQDLISNKLGEEYLYPPAFDLKASYETSTMRTAIILILTPGSDPITPLMSFGETSSKHREEVHIISLGQGQGEFAESEIRQGAEEGWWVVLQNCHLAQSWLGQLEMICHEILSDENTKPEFRLWLTTYPCFKFPVSLLQDAIKITNEPPRGLRANLLKSYLSHPISDQTFFNHCSKESGFHRLVFGLCFFHALVQERSSYGALGWNVPYEFNDSDLRISALQLQMLLETEPSTLPLEALIYLTGECNYGGKVTDEQDRRLLLCLLETLYNDKITETSKHCIFGMGEYSIPDTNKWVDHVACIKKMPTAAPPYVFGLHPSAELARDCSETDKLFSAVLYLEPRLSTTTATEASGEIVLDLASEILSRIPPLFDLNVVEEKHPLSYNQSLNTVLRQEILRYNRLLATIKQTLKEVRRAVMGEAVLSEELEEIYKAILIGNVPAAWMARSYPSRKVLASYISDLIHRLKFFMRWIDDQVPDVFWFSGFFFPHSFLTGIRQNFSRKHKIPIDSITFEFKVMGKEVQDIIQECIKPNFVELPERIECLPTPEFRGTYEIVETDVEGYSSDESGNENETTNDDDIGESPRKADEHGPMLVMEEEDLEGVVFKVIPKPWEGGVYAWGFFLEGVRWDRELKCLAELNRGQLYDELPIILFQPTLSRHKTIRDGDGTPQNGPKISLHKPEDKMYPCPIYRTSERQGTISTTGHSSNYIMDLHLPTHEDVSHWVMRGAAALTQLDD